MKTKKYYFTCYNDEGRKHGVYKWYQGGTLYIECIRENGKIVGECK